MQQSIPISQISQVLPSVLAGAGSAVDINGLIISQNPAIPVGQALSFTNSADVGSFFGLASIEYQAAVIYFAGPTNSTRTPGLLFFTQYVAAPVGAFLRGGSMAATTLSQLQAVSGTLTVTTNGTPLTSASINLSSAVSFSAAAATIQAAFTSPPFAVTYDSQRAAYVFTTTATGATQVIGYASGTAAAGLKLDAADGAITSPGAAASTAATYMPTVLTALSNFATFTTTWEPVLADKISFSNWAAAQNGQYAFCGYDSDPNAILATGSQTAPTWAQTIDAGSGTIPVYGNITHAALIMSWAGSLNFTQTAGRNDLAFTEQAGIVASCSNGTQAVNLATNGYNFYGAYASKKSNYLFLFNGQCSGPFLWADSFINQIWMNGSFQDALVNLLISVGSIPYNTDGYTQIESTLSGPIQAAINFGAIRTGVQPSSTEAAILLQKIGKDVSNVLFQTGYYLNIQPASSTTRIARTSPPMTLYYMDGQSMQQLNLASIELP